MSRYESGYCLLHRRVGADHDNIFDGSFKLLGLWSVLLVWANWRDGDRLLGRHKITLKRGQLITSQEQLCRKGNVSRKELRLMLEKLENAGAIIVSRAKEGPTNGTIITIVNYDYYQGKDDQENGEKGQRRAKEGPKRGQRGAKEGPHSETGKQGKQGTINPQEPPSVEAGLEGKDSSLGGGQQSSRPRKTADDRHQEATAIVAKLTSFDWTPSEDRRMRLQSRLGARGWFAYVQRFGDDPGAFLPFWEGAIKRREKTGVIRADLRDAIAGFLAELDEPPGGAA